MLEDRSWTWDSTSCAEVKCNPLKGGYTNTWRPTSIICSDTTLGDLPLITPSGAQVKPHKTQEAVIAMTFCLASSTLESSHCASPIYIVAHWSGCNYGDNSVFLLSLLPSLLHWHAQDPGSYFISPNMCTLWDIHSLRDCLQFAENEYVYMYAILDELLGTVSSGNKLQPTLSSLRLITLNLKCPIFSSATKNIQKLSV